MKSGSAAAFSTVRFAVVLLCLVMTAFFVLPGSVFAEEADKAEKTIRVGWYETPFNYTDQFGRRSGYAYEYQRKIAAYTGWKYEYVEGNWLELLHKLEKGDIDLMSDVSFTKERAKTMLFPSLPMGGESYYIYISPDNTDVMPENYSSLNGKRIGVTRSSVQQDLFLDWEKKNGVKAKLVEMTCSEEESLRKLNEEGLDAFVTLDVYGDPNSAKPICKIGSSDIFFAVNKDRPDLLTELDAAMNRIQDENVYYNQELYEKYLHNANTESYLTNEEKKWLEDHGVIRVGYQDNYLAFCASDESTGELTGALKDYLEFASDSMENAHLDFEAVAYPTASDAIEALNQGEVDCMFPANLTDYDGETLSVVMTSALMRTEMYAVVRSTEQQSFVRKKDVTVAVNEGNPNYDMFLVDNFPGWKVKHYKDTPACLEAVAAGEADCIIISNYRFNNIAKQCEKLQLTTVSTGVDLDYCFAVREGDTALYSILSRVTSTVPQSTANAALTYYSSEDAKTGFFDNLRDHLAVAIAVILAVILIILLLLLRSIRMEKKAIEEHHLVDNLQTDVRNLSRRVFVDPLTSVRNKGAFSNYIQEMQEQLERGEWMEFAIGVFDCDNLKVINDENGHDKGDEYLKAASRLICRTFQHSPVFRIGGDEFSVVLRNEDYRNREELLQQFRKEREEICANAENDWDKVSVAMGMAEYDSRADHSVIDTVRRADKIMYADKRLRKEARESGRGEED